MIDADFVNEIKELAETAVTPEVLVNDKDDKASVFAYRVRGTEHIEQIDVERYLPQPYRKKGKLTFYNVDSFATYVEKHRSDATLMVADGMKVVAYLNHHAQDAAGWSDHVATLEMRVTPAMQAWSEFVNKMFDQEDFANFLEAHITDIAEPAAGDVLDLARELRIHSNATFERVIRPGDGTVQYVYQDEHTPSTPKGTIDMKDGFPVVVAFQAFEGGETLSLEGKVRYKLTNGELSFGLYLTDFRRKLDAAVEERIAAIETKLGDPVLRGVLHG